LDFWTSTRHKNAEKLSMIVHWWTKVDAQFRPELFEHANRIIQFGFESMNGEIVDLIPDQKAKTPNQF
jgi:hypothetical protein